MASAVRARATWILERLTESKTISWKLRSAAQIRRPPTALTGGGLRCRVLRSLVRQVSSPAHLTLIRSAASGWIEGCAGQPKNECISMFEVQQTRARRVKEVGAICERQPKMQLL